LRQELAALMPPLNKCRMLSHMARPDCTRASLTLLSLVVVLVFSMFTIRSSGNKVVALAFAGSGSCITAAQLQRQHQAAGGLGNAAMIWRASSAQTLALATLYMAPMLAVADIVSTVSTCTHGSVALLGLEVTVATR
jgi:hypothetical protein